MTAVVEDLRPEQRIERPAGNQLTWTTSPIQRFHKQLHLGRRFRKVYLWPTVDTAQCTIRGGMFHPIFCKTRTRS